MDGRIAIAFGNNEQDRKRGEEIILSREYARFTANRRPVVLGVILLALCLTGYFLLEAPELKAMALRVTVLSGILTALPVVSTLINAAVRASKRRKLERGELSGQSDWLKGAARLEFGEKTILIFEHGEELPEQEYTGALAIEYSDGIFLQTTAFVFFILSRFLTSAKLSAIRDRLEGALKKNYHCVEQLAGTGGDGAAGGERSCSAQAVLRA